MKVHRLCIILSLAGMLANASAFAAAETSVCDSLKVIQDENSALRLQNCTALISQGLVPNAQALNFSLKYLGDNYGKLADPTCADTSVSVGKNVLTKDEVAKGIHNGCQFVVNDLNSKYPGSPTRSNAYYVDLCSKDPGKLVTKFYMNKGTGTGKHGYSDSEGDHSTVAGAFLTDESTFKFVPFKLSSGYKSIIRKLGYLPALRLVGLNSSNNDTDYGKPIHVSPYKSSWGCPSVDSDNAWILQKLAENGPSLLMNYGPSSLHQSTTSCENLPAKKTASAKVAVKKKKGGRR